MNTTVYYERTRPLLTIEATGGSKLGNCYYESRYRITSTNPLTPERVRNLLDGENIYGNAGTDIRGGVEPAGYDITPPVEVNQAGEIVSRNPIDKYSGEPYKATSAPYYVAEVAVRIDSGD